MEHDPLIEFHLGTIERPQREQIEKLLKEDSALLSDYFNLKRDLEEAELSSTAPSPQIRSLLRSEVKTLGSPRWYWNRPVGIGAGIAAAMGLLLYFLVSTQSPETDRGVLVDTPTHPASLDYI